MMGLLVLLIAQAPEYQRLFDDTKIHSIHITLSAGDYTKLGKRPFEWFKGAVEIDGEKFDAIGVRAKGNSSTQIRSEKKPFKLDFSQYDPKGRCRGLRQLALNNGFKDPTLLREKLAYDLFRSAGCPASRAAFAQVYLTVPGKYDREYFGVYTIVEPVDDPFLDERFGSHEGNLFKPEGFSDLFSRVDERRIYDEKSVELKTNKKKNDRSRLVAFAKAVADPSADLSKWLDVDSFLRWLAVNTALANLDSYAGTGHNYYLYDDPKSGKFIFIPWDLNEAFGNFQVGPAEDLLDLDVLAPGMGRKALVDRVLGTHKKRYQELLKAFCENEFAPAALSRRIDALHRLIFDAASKDDRKMYPTSSFEKGISEDLEGRPPMLSKILGLKPFVEKRSASILDQLAGRRPGKRLPDHRPGPPPGGPPPGGPPPPRR